MVYIISYFATDAIQVISASSDLLEVTPIYLRQMQGLRYHSKRVLSHNHRALYPMNAHHELDHFGDFFITGTD
jgi:hypothetical protein